MQNYIMILKMFNKIILSNRGQNLDGKFWIQSSLLKKYLTSLKY